MKKKFSIKSYLLWVFLAGLLCLAVFFTVDKLRERENGKNLDLLISELTYLPEDSSVEISVMEKFSPNVKNMSQRNQARYYGVLTKLYMLRGDTDTALLRSVEGEIHAELSKAYDVSAWIYADIAQAYVDLDAASVALDCVDTALAYGQEVEMSDFFYAYCYLLKADIEAKLQNTEEAHRAYEQVLSYEKAEEHQEYHSMEQRKNLVKAALMLQEGELEEAGRYLQELALYIQNLDDTLTDALWYSAIYYPYLTLQTKLCLQQGYYSAAAKYLDETFATGFLYGQISNLMNFLNEVLDFMEQLEQENPDAPVEDLRKQLSTNIEKLIREYPKAFQNRNTIAATHIYNSNMITIAVFVQQFRTQHLYGGIATGVVIVLLIIGILLGAIRQSEHKGRIDGLTGAYIRRYFNQVYEELKDSDKEFGVIMYDIDFFKQINDGFGHDAGDQALRQTAQMVMNLLDRGSQLFRFGGDEFCIICRKKTLEEMAELAERIRSNVEHMKWQEGMKVSFSMGVAIASKSEDRDVMAMADKKLYASKEAGRNHVSW